MHILKISGIGWQSAIDWLFGALKTITIERWKSIAMLSVEE